MDKISSEQKIQIFASETPVQINLYWKVQKSSEMPQEATLADILSNDY